MSTPPAGLGARLASAAQTTFGGWVPDSLMGRSALIIVIPLILFQVISTFIFYDNHWDTLSRRLAVTLAGDINTIRAYRADHPGPDGFRWIQETAWQSMQLKIDFRDGAVLNAQDVIDEQTETDNAITFALQQYLNRPFVIDDRSLETEVIVRVQLSDGVLDVIASRKRLFSTTTIVFVLWMVGSSLLLFGVAALFLSRQVRSVRRLARAADAFGKGRDVPDFRPEGASEVRQAADAFVTMRNRIARQIQQRTDMLAGVSHDLRTPLTRMKLELAMLKGCAQEDIKDLQDDVAEMERMLDAYLDFARGQGGEELKDTDLFTLISDVVRRQNRLTGNIAWEQANEGLRLPLRPQAFERCVTNLISNAARFGTEVRVRVVEHAPYVLVIVEDNGPGVPEAKREDVFRAFYRVEASRNPETGGVGLGMTIARDVARAHGGDIVLEDSELGGLKATVRLPH